MSISLSLASDAGDVAQWPWWKGGTYPNVSPWLKSCNVSPMRGSPRLPSGSGKDVTASCTWETFCVNMGTMTLLHVPERHLQMYTPVAE